MDVVVQQGIRDTVCELTQHVHARCSRTTRPRTRPPIPKDAEIHLRYSVQVIQNHC